MALNVEACFGLVDGLEQLFVSAGAPVPQRFATRRWHRQHSSSDGGGLSDAEVLHRRRSARGGRVAASGRFDEELTPLLLAANDGQVQVARGLLGGRGGRGGVEVDRARADGLGTPLLQASFQGFVDVAKLLLDHRSDPNKPSCDSTTPLLIAAQQGFVDVGQAALGS